MVDLDRFFESGENEEPDTIKDEVILRDPFINSRLYDAIETEFPVNDKDLFCFKNFCLKNKIGAYEIEYPFMTEMINKQDVIDIIDEVSKLVDECQCDNWYETIRKKISKLN